MRPPSRLETITARVGAKPAGRDEVVEDRGTGIDSGIVSPSRTTRRSRGAAEAGTPTVWRP